MISVRLLARPLVASVLILVLGIAIGAILADTTTAQADTTRYVKVGGTGDGTSWAAASGNLQAMIDVVEATGGGTVCVASGTYTPTMEVGGGGPRYQSFQMKNGVAIYGGFPNTGSPSFGLRNWQIHKAVLSGDIGIIGDNSDNCYHVFRHPGSSSLNNSAVLDGFTITAGNASLYNQYDGDGAGMYNHNCNPHIRNCKFIRNMASSEGGGIYNYYSDPIIDNCSFIQNQREGIVNSHDASPFINSCIFYDNYNSGIRNYNHASPLITNCLFYKNQTGLDNDYYCSPVVTNCTFHKNSDRGISLFDYCDPVITNCIIWENGNGAYYEVWDSHYSNPIITYCDVKGAYAGIGNIDHDPCFVDGLRGDLHILSTSPCKNSGTNAAANLLANDFESDSRILDGTVDMGADEIAGYRSIVTNDLPAGGSVLIDPPGPVYTDETIITLTAVPSDYCFFGGWSGDLEGNINPGTVTMDSDKFMTASFEFNGTVIYVNDNASGTKEGSSWANAFTDLQTALDLATPGKEIWVASGTYLPSVKTNPSDDRTATFHLKNGPALYGGFSGMESLRNQRSWETNVTTLSGDIGISGDNTDNCYHVVTSGTDGGTLDGFTITDGYSYADSSSDELESGGGLLIRPNSFGTITNCSIKNNAAEYGGGMSVGYGSSPQVINCLFEQNETYGSAGAVYNAGGSSPLFSKCRFISNSALHYNGGAISNIDCYPIITDCLFEDNSARDGGAIYDSDGEFSTVTNCTFLDNHASGVGGGIYYYNSSFYDSTISDCIFSGNSAVSGGGIYNVGSITNCIIFDNTATDRGGGITAVKNIINCTIVGNTANDGGGVSSVRNVENSIIWGNTASRMGDGIMTDNYDDTVIRFSNTQGGFSGTGNICANPEFVNSGSGDFHLLPSSPCINSGSNVLVPNGVIEDYEGNSRIISSTVDMGALESPYSSPSALTLPATNVGTHTVTLNGLLEDLGGDSSVDVSFIWGRHSGGPYPNETPSQVMSGTGSFSTKIENLRDDITYYYQAKVCGIGTDYGIERNFATSGEAEIIYVNDDASGANNGYSWVNAFADLQDALDVAGNGDQIWVASGTYVPTVIVTEYDPTDIRMAAFQMKNNVVIYGGFSGIETSLIDRDWENNASILSGEIGDPEIDYDNCNYVINNTPELLLNNSAVLDGFTITDGYWAGIYTHEGSPTIVNCRLFKNSESGMHNYEASPNISNCTFVSNGQYGMYNEEHSSPNVSNCTFRSNSGCGMANNYGSSPAVEYCDFIGNQGGGMSNSSHSSPTVVECSFYGNTGYYIGGMYNRDGSEPKITNCLFENNQSERDGGGMYNYDASPVITDCVFSENRAGWDGGGIYNEDYGTPRIANTVFSSNTAKQEGGAMSNYRSAPNVVNCTFWGNTASIGGGMHNWDHSEAEIANCIFWGNSGSIAGDGILDSADSNSSVIYTSTQGYQSGTGNIVADPMLVNPGSGDFHLLATSPCINSGSNAYIPLGIDEDFEGDPRIINGIVDMGVDESVFDAPFVSTQPATNVGTYTATLNGMLKDLGGASSVQVSFVLGMTSGGPYPNETAAQSLSIPGYFSVNIANLYDNATYYYQAKVVNESTDFGKELSFTTTNVPATIYVDAKASGMNNGTSWDDAFNDLQGALDICGVGDQIWVASGTYYPSRQIDPAYLRTAAFELVNGVPVYGGFDPLAGDDQFEERDWQDNPVILSGDIGIRGDDSDNSYFVVYCSQMDDSTIIDGLMITSATAEGNVYPDNGGIYIDESSPIITNCRFFNNNSWGMRNHGSSPTITNCAFSNNAIGGMNNESYSAPVVNNCVFSANEGAGMRNDYSSPVLNDCVFNGNSGNYGGGMRNDDSSPVITNCIFSNNSAGDGGGMDNDYSNPIVVNCIFTHNTAGAGGAISNWVSYPEFINCVMFGNSEDYSGRPAGAIFNFADSESKLTNCILWGNTSNGVASDIWGDAIVTFSDLQTNISGIGNICGTPMFVNSGSGDFRLLPDSPCIDVGTNLIDPMLDIDFEGNSRLIDGNDDGIKVIDMGAFEYGDDEPGTYHSLHIDSWGDGVVVEPGLQNPYYCLEGLDVYLQAVPGPGWMFSHWSGKIDTVANPGSPGTTITMDSPRSITAHFIPEAAVWVDDDWIGTNPGSPVAGHIFGDDAYATVQAGINSTTDPLRIYVAPGTYTESITLRSNIIVTGSSAEFTVLRGSQGSVVTAKNLNSNTRIEGFTITNGRAFQGAGMYCQNASHEISHCIFTSNSATRGGAIYDEDSSPTILDCVLMENSADSGGGLYNYDHYGHSSPVIKDCEFLYNAATKTGYNSGLGGAIYNDGGSLNTIRCVFQNNSAVSGGAIYNEDSYSPDLLIEDCHFIGNQAEYSGGAIVNGRYSTLEVVNSVFSGNRSSTESGGAICNMYGSDIVLINSTFHNNRAYDYGGDLYSTSNSSNYKPSATLINCILWGGSPTAIYVDQGSVTASYCDIENGFEGIGNIMANPQFVDVDSGNFHLEPNSPCIDAGTNSAVYSVLSDFEGDNRILDGNTVLGAVVDMGADEYVSTANTIVIDADPNALNAPWILEGPNGFVYNGSGDETLVSPELGQYSLTWTDISGYITPSPNPDIQTLSEGIWLLFAGRYLTEPAIAVTPSAHDFGIIATGTFSDTVFVIENVGEGTLSGQVSVGFPFSVIGSGTYTIPGNASHPVQIRFAPTGVQHYESDLVFTGGGDAICAVEGLGFEPLADVWVDDNWGGHSYGDPVDGHTYGIDAFDGINEGMIVVDTGGTVHVAPGTYYETIQLRNGVRIQGAGAGHDPAVHSIISGDVDRDGTGDGSVITAIDNDFSAVIDGFKITNGTGTLDPWGTRIGGGGMYIEHASPVVSNCLFYQNVATDGAGIYNYHSSPIIRYCTFAENASDEDGGGICNVDKSSPVIANCRFERNQGHKDGGGIFNGGNSSPEIVNCTFWGNEATGQFPGPWDQIDGFGGAICNTEDCSPDIINCTFHLNKAARMGGGVFNYNNSLPKISNCIFYSNMPNQIEDYGSYCISEVTYSNIIEGYPGEGNIDQYPSFIDAYNGNFNLGSNSPCIDAGSILSLPHDRADLDDDGDVLEFVSVDGNGDNRLFGGRVDMGAYESPYDREDVRTDETTEITNYSATLNGTLLEIGDDTSVIVSFEWGAQPGTFTNFTGPQSITSAGGFSHEINRLSPGITYYYRAKAISSWTTYGNVEAFTAACVSESTTYYVDINATGSNNGQSWQDAFSALQSALEVVSPCDEIWVAAGTYVPTNALDSADDRTMTFEIPEGVMIYGGFDPTAGDIQFSERDPQTNVTVLSGEIGNPGTATDNAYHVLYCRNIDNPTVIDGFAITGGYADTSGNYYGGGIYTFGASALNLSNCIITDNVSVQYGGGMYNAESSPLISDCTFSNNTGSYGGGIYNNSSSPTIINCSIYQNIATSKYGYGAGICNGHSSDPTIHQCDFYGNQAVGTYSEGGGISNFICSSPEITNCTFTANQSEYGGAISSNSSIPIIRECTFTSNIAAHGGALNNDNSSAQVTNCVFHDNGAGLAGPSGNGGAVRNDESASWFDSCLFRENKSSSGGAFYSLKYPSPVMMNCIFWQNRVEGASSKGGAMYVSSGTPVITNCVFVDNVASGTYGTGGAIYVYREVSPIITNSILWNNQAQDAGDQIFKYQSASMLSSSVSKESSSKLDRGLAVPVEHDEALRHIEDRHMQQSLEDEGATMVQLQAETSASATLKTVTYCTIEGGYPGIGNIDQLPAFYNSSNGDFHLLPISPCIDAGTNLALNLPAEDFEGDDRIINGTVDMGADEVTRSPWIYDNDPEDGAIEYGEMVAALMDYLTSGISYSQMIDVLMCYLTS